MPRRIIHFLAPTTIQGRLLLLATAFVFLFALALTVSPAARERSWSVEYRLSHWAGAALWAGVFYAAHIQIRRRIPDADPFLLPLAALLSGWGLLTIWRLAGGLGMRQAFWLVAAGATLIAGLRLAPELRFLRRYRYLFLTGGLLLTALTLLFGTNPLGNGPRLWLGCCGFYIQPSEPLKLLLLVYLSAYMADRLPLGTRLLPLLAPTAVVTGLALLLLVFQRDLGTASIFFFLYAIVLYVACGNKRVLWFSLIGLATTGLAGYRLFDVVRLRVEAWLNPWLDPAGRSYQIVQSLLAVANGGIGGRGPGLGSPGLVPVAHSDFVFPAIAEESGLIGALGLLMLMGLFVARGVRVSLRAPDQFRRLLAAGLTAFLGAQAILIVGGTLRLLPLTGVTLPFVSYGGSSLVTSFLAILLLLLISSQPEDDPAPLPHPQPYRILAALLGGGLLAAALTTGWWAVARGPDLLTRTDNARRSIADRYVRRGALFDREGMPVTSTEGKAGDYRRVYLYPDLGPVTGYTHPIFGQSGLEASLDEYLRGLQGNPASRVWWEHLLYGQPPPGLDVRLSIDLALQEKADSLLGDRAGAAILLNAASGEILAMASHPTYDPNRLDDLGEELNRDSASPLVNRAAQGRYPAGEMAGFFAGATGRNGTRPEDPANTALFEALGFYTPPALRLPVALASRPGENLLLSPLQAALATAALCNQGLRPAPRLATAVDTPEQGWVILPPMGEPVQALPATEARALVESLLVDGEPFWQWTGRARGDQAVITWYLAGTLPDWQAAPLAVVVLLERNAPLTAGAIGRALLHEAVDP